MSRHDKSRFAVTLFALCANCGDNDKDDVGTVSISFGHVDGRSGVIFHMPRVTITLLGIGTR